MTHRSKLSRLTAALLAASFAMLVALPLQAQKKSAKPSKSSSPTVHRLKDHGLEFISSSKWQERDGPKSPGAIASMVYFDSASKTTAMMMVKTIPASDDKTFDAAMAEYARKMNCCGPHFTIGEPVATKVGGEPGQTLLLTGNDARAKGHNAYMVSAQRGANIYVFMFQGSDKNLKVIQTEADRMVKTVKWTGPKPAATTKPAATAKPAAPAPTASPSQVAEPGDGL